MSEQASRGLRTGRRVVILEKRRKGVVSVLREGVLGGVVRWEHRWLEYSLILDQSGGPAVSVTLLVPVAWVNLGPYEWIIHAYRRRYLPDTIPGPFTARAHFSSACPGSGRGKRPRTWWYGIKGLDIGEIKSLSLGAGSEKVPIAVAVGEDVPTERTPEQKAVSRVQFAALCWTLTLGGWNDGSTGALLPRIQKVYNVEFIILSLIFVFACAGFMAGSVFNMYLTPRLGFGKTLVLGSVCQLAAYCIQSSAPPFPVFVMGYAISGIGLSLQDAQANGFVASLKYDATSKMGIIHSAYGFGLLIAPFVSTQFAQLPRWSFHFLVSLGLSLSNTAVQISIFKFKSLDGKCPCTCSFLVPSLYSCRLILTYLACLEQGGEPAPEKAPDGEGSLFRQVMRNWTIHLFAFFIVVHLGVGVTIGGWIVTYIIDVRGGDASSGYISAGVSGGVMIGRLGLLWVNKKVGERNAIFLYSLICIKCEHIYTLLHPILSDWALRYSFHSLEIVVWLVPSLIGNAVAVCFVGFFLGPMYPIAINQATRILPGWILTGAVGWIAGFGQTGSALVPFMTGAIASKDGLKIMPPLLVGMTSLMMLIWAFVPNKPRNTANT
ncbi:major facilitator superfamily domain-containing protein [Flammula alnicola]|nr:major facilitator superfamily domain-containing protein [Flammula alnicola]